MSVTFTYEQDTVIKGKDNPLVINFTFSIPSDPTFGLDTFTEIDVNFGAEDYSLTADPTIVVVNSNTQLQLNLGDTAEPYPSYLTIVGTNATYPDGYELTSKCLGNQVLFKMC